MKAEFKSTIWAAGAQACPLFLPLGSHRPAENKCDDLIFHAGSSRIPCSIWGVGEGVQNRLQLSAHVCGNLGLPISNRQKPNLYQNHGIPSFPNCWLRWLLFHLVRNLVREERSYLLGPFRDQHLVYYLKILANNKIGTQLWGRK